jgi:ArsR family transcriptional regulator
MERLPLADGSADVALLSQALHHAETPPQVVGEAVRVVRPGGRVLVLDLAPHDQAWVEERLGDRWRGFDQGVLSAWLREGGLTDVRVEVGARAKGDPFVVVIASGIRPRRRPRAASGARSNGARRRGSTA